MEEDAAPCITDYENQPPVGYIKPVRIRSGPKRKRLFDDEGPKPDGYEQYVAEGKTPPTIPPSEGGPPPSKVATKALDAATDALRLLRRRLDNYIKSPTKAAVMNAKDVKDLLCLLMADILSVAEHHRGICKVFEGLKITAADVEKVTKLAESSLFKSVSFNLCVNMGSYGVIVDTVLAQSNMTVRDLACEAMKLTEEDGRELMMRALEMLIKLIRVYIDKTRDQ